MTTLDRLAAWRDDGVVSGGQHDRLAALVRGDRISVLLELNALLYVGVLTLAGGVAWTINTRFEDLGDAAIIAALSALLAACAYYCLSRAPAYAPTEVPSPGMVFDYALYLGAVVLGIELGYVESRFGLLGDRWDLHVLLSALAFFAAAYRFDNRFVLSLALSALAAWFGIKFTAWGLLDAAFLRASALAYGLVAAGLGLAGQRASVKAHFVDAYLHVAVTVMFAALLSGVADAGTGPVYVAAVLTLAVLSIRGGLVYRRFAFVAYGIVYGYLAISYQIISAGMGPTLILAYGVVSGSAVIVLLVVLARQVGREP